jgi:hypothetical protein
MHPGQSGDTLSGLRLCCQRRRLARRYGYVASMVMTAVTTDEIEDSPDQPALVPA